VADQTKARGLGRGLAALVAEFPGGGGTASVEIELDRIRPNARQPRRTFDDSALDGLVASIRAAGLVQAIRATASRSSPASGAGAQRGRPAWGRSRRSCATPTSARRSSWRSPRTSPARI
jgi:ParB family chromosome partitioning protein